MVSTLNAHSSLKIRGSMSLHKKALECGITPSCRKENRSLFDSIIAGNKAAQRLVEGNMGYVVTKVECFLDEHPDFRYFKDDLISEGFLVLTRIADTLKEVAEDEFAPQGLISTALQYAFVRMTEKEREVPLSDVIADNLGYDDTPATDMKLDIFACCQNITETRIVQLRCEGLMDSHIATLLGMSKRHVGRLRDELLDRFQKTRGF